MVKEILDKNELTTLYNFIEKYGKNGLMDALNNYESSQELYICKSKSFTKRIPIVSINYIEIFGHEIIIHTTNGDFSKYGTLKNELKQLKNKGFVKCNQSFLIPTNKIAEIIGKNVVLTTGDKFILSRGCIADVISAYEKNIEKHPNTR